MFVKLYIGLHLTILLYLSITIARISCSRRLRFPLMRTKRGLRDLRGVPTENLKGRPGQGYYIAVEVGSPPQRVSAYIHFKKFLI